MFKKLPFHVAFVLFFAFSFLSQSFAQNTNCADPDPFCASYTTQFFNVNASGADASVTNPGNNYDCLFTSPRPSWFYLEIQNGGNLDMHMTGYDVFGFAVDVDFILYGPFSNLTNAIAGCNNYGNGGSGANVLDCSYDPSPDEDINIVGATTGQVYILLVTGYSIYSNDYSLVQTGGTATTNCNIINTGNCGETLYDNGGASGDYVNNVSTTVTLCPTTPGGTVTINFSAFSTESGYDFVNIYNGSGTTSLLGSYSGTTFPPSTTSTAPNGCLTVTFSSDGSVVSSGYAYTVVCNPPPAVCNIASISFVNASVCNNNGTPSNAADDYFTVDIIVNYSNKPASGTLNLSGGATASVSVASIGASTYTFTGVTFPANGVAASVTASFSANVACTLNNSGGPAVASCSTPACTPNNGTWN